jgi:hypothetical protein
MPDGATLAEVELYDLSSQAGSNHNLASSHPAETRMLFDRARSAFGERPGTATLQPDASVIHALEALGYVDPNQAESSSAAGP